MHELMLASMLMSLVVISMCMVWSQYREDLGKQSLLDVALSWLFSRLS